MGRDDPIERYLVELDAELRLPARVRRRIVAEAREHLRDASRHTGAFDALAQMQAIESFGTPAAVAADFARELAIGSTHRATRRGGVLFVLSLVLWDLCTSSFIHLAPAWVNDGPGSALLWILGQVGLVAGTVSLARARVVRRTNTVDSTRLRYAVRGLIVLATCTAITVLLTGIGVASEFGNSATRHGPILLGAVILACAALTVTTAATAWRAHTRLGALEHGPLSATGREALRDVSETIGEGLGWAGRRVPLSTSVTRAIRMSRGSLINRALSLLDPSERPWRYGCAVALLAGVAIPLLDGVVLVVKGQLDGRQLTDLAATAPLLIAIEASLVISGYAILGRYLGLRPAGRRSAER
jgi:hypothetical protein